jgi:hypothetical protein
MFVGKLNAAGGADLKDPGRITCHTMSRFGHDFWNDAWWLHDTYNYTLIHLSADDASASPAAMKLLDGWWRIEVAGRKEYHHYSRGRIARLTMYEPKSANEPAKSTQDSGHWWELSGTRLVTIWRKSGVVVEWSVKDATSSTQSVTVAGIHGTAARLF